MRTVIAGGTGFLGRPLAASLAAHGHHVTLLSRSADSHGAPASGQPLQVAWLPDGSAGAWASVVDGADAVVNLAGESIAGRRWTAAQKAKILDSRVNATRSLVAAIANARTPPRVFVSGSAVGYYGPLGDEIVDETARPGGDFLANVCAAWEAEAARAADRCRVVCIRTGLVLERDGGALPQMLPPFWFGAGGPVGSGRQYWPWIHRADWIAMVEWAIATTAVNGPIDVTAPTPETNRSFAQALGRALHRPAFLPAPAFALRLLLGEMADALLLSGQRAVPAQAQRLGFTFSYSRLDDALSAIFSTRRAS
ncbi:MAG TPA: TIGR01777 family oxidoreductase [Vicinamibacterales bacterium]|nr:TIGR01777 family oxidoreductase [Vicinamibacterales bacterium]